MSNKNVNVRKSQEITFCLLAGILMFMAMMVAGRAEAGVALGATRVIYPAGQKQVQLAVTNNDENSTYLIQSWVPTPYYLTVTELNAGTRVLENALVPPMGESAVKLPSDAGSNITYRTINDYGALTPKMTGVME